MKWPFRFKAPPPIDSGAALARFLDEECAYLAQKSATDYCWAKAGLNAQKLFSEPAFQAALNVCRWESFAAMLSDATLLVEGRLRAAAPESAELAASVIRLHAAVLRRHAAPAHLPQGWEPEIAAFAQRLAQARLAPPQPAATLARTGAKRLFDALPIHPELRRHDYEVVENAVRFGLVALAVKLDERLDVAAAVRDLEAQPIEIDSR